MIGEYDAEPVEGLPAPLPDGERMLWQGAPDWRVFARRVFHVRKIAAYFALIALWQAVTSVYDGGTVAGALIPLTVTLALGSIAVGLLGLIAWSMARTTLYTLTTRRLVFRIGVALPMSVNVPFAAIEAARVKRRADGSGDLSLLTAPAQRASYLVMWPHVRPWRFARSEPALRALPEVDAVAERVSAALRAYHGTPVETAPAAEREQVAVPPLAVAAS